MNKTQTVRKLNFLNSLKEGTIIKFVKKSNNHLSYYIFDLNTDEVQSLYFSQERFEYKITMMVLNKNHFNIKSIKELQMGASIDEYFMVGYFPQINKCGAVYFPLNDDVYFVA